MIGWYSDTFRIKASKGDNQIPVQDITFSSYKR